MTSVAGCDWTTDWGWTVNSCIMSADVLVTLPVDVSPDSAITVPGSCNAIDKLCVSVETHWASKLGGCAVTSEPL